MTEPPIEDNPSDDVLEELLGAFSVDSSPAGTDAASGRAGRSDSYDFDDPSIDRLLGITAGQPVVPAAPAAPAARKSIDTEPDLKPAKAAKAVSDEVNPATVKPTTVVPTTGKPAKEKPPREKRGRFRFGKRKAEQVPPAPVAAKAATPARKQADGERPTIVIGGDELPDAVFLDVEREEKFLERRVEDGNKERSTIVITDFDEAAPIDAAAVRSSMGGAGGGSADQRIRARRISVRRAEGRRRLRWVVIGLLVIALPVATLAVLASPLFDVSNVAVQGATYTDPTLLATIIDDITGDPVLLVDTQEIEKRLESDPWVERVKVETDFPHTVRIDIRERTPVASFQGGDGRFRIIDYQGRVLDVIDGIPVDYMLITGENPDTARGQFAGAPYSAAAELVLTLPSEIRILTETVGLNAATGALSLQLDGGAVVQLGDASDMDRKLARLLTHVRSGTVGICEVDVSTSEVGIVPC